MIKYEKYTSEVSQTEFIKRINEDGSETYIPMDETNSDYQAYLRWLENPNAPEFQTPWVEPQLTK